MPASPPARRDLRVGASPGGVTYVYDANDPERHPLAQGSEALCAVVAAGKPIFVKQGSLFG